MPRIAYRVGAHWGVTVVETDLDLPADDHGRRSGDRLIAMAATPSDAVRIADAMTQRAKTLGGVT